MPAEWWPSPSDYQDTVQNPRVAFSDPALRDGQVVCDALGLPKPISGSFATVFQVEYAGRRHAVRCFLRHVPDIAQRYTAISAYLQQVSMPYMVGFRFLDKGIRMRGEWFPVLKMDWLEGERLDVYVGRHLNDAAALLKLARQLLQLAATMRQAKIAHGDLQHGNLLVVNHRLRLLDYDGMFVPALAGRGSNELGQPNYQHPSRSARDYGPHIDNFSVWVITLSLLGLALDSTLRSSFSSSSEFLLLQHSDFDNPSASQALSALQQSSSPILRSLTLSFIPFLFASDLASIPSLEPQALSGLETNTPLPAALPDWLRERIPPTHTGAAVSAPVALATQPNSAEWLLDHLHVPPSQPLSGAFRVEKYLLMLTAIVFLAVVGMMSAALVPPSVGLPLLALLPLTTLLTLNLVFSLRYNSPERHAAVRAVHALEDTRLKLQGQAQQLTANLARLAHDEQTEMANLVAQQTAIVIREKTALAALDQTLQSELTRLDERRKEIVRTRESIFQTALIRLQAEQLDHALKGFRVADALLPGIISRELKQTLARHGFITAADITTFQVNRQNPGQRFCLVNRRGTPQHIAGLNPAQGIALILWRRTLEARAKRSIPVALPADIANALSIKIQDELATLGRAEIETRQQAQHSKTRIAESAHKENERLMRGIRDLPAAYRLKVQAAEQELARAQKAIAQRDWALVLARRRLQTFAHINFPNYLKSILGL